MDIEKIIQNQRDVLKEYDKSLEELANNKDIKEISELKLKLDNLNEKVVQLAKDNKKLSDENLNLKYTLKEYCVAEKINIIESHKKKTNIYFDETNSKKLKSIEIMAQTKIQKMNMAVEKDLQDNYMEIQEEINEFGKYIKSKVDEKIEQAELTKITLRQEIDSKYEDLKKEDISDEVVEKRIRNKNIETKIGLNLINKIGIILMLLGVATLFKHTYTSWLNEHMKAIIGFTVGIIFLFGGEWLNKKEQNVFSIGLTSLGIGTLYISIFNTFFLLKIISMPVALSLSLLTTIISILLSLKYNSKVISIISLFGGYLPLLAYSSYYGLTSGLANLAMIYLLLLNFSVLVVNSKKRWLSLQYASLIMNLPTSIYLLYNSSNNYVSIVYLLATFFVYLGIVIINPLKYKKVTKYSEVILLSINTIFNAISMYYVFDKLKWNSNFGFITLFYGIGFYLLRNLMVKNDDKKGADLFLISSISFSTIATPL